MGWHWVLEQLRTVRLAVDTGKPAFPWSEKAIFHEEFRVLSPETIDIQSVVLRLVLSCKLLLVYKEGRSLLYTTV